MAAQEIFWHVTIGKTKEHWLISYKHPNNDSHDMLKAVEPGRMQEVLLIHVTLWNSLYFCNTPFRHQLSCSRYQHSWYIQKQKVSFGVDAWHSLQCSCTSLPDTHCLCFVAPFYTHNKCDIWSSLARAETGTMFTTLQLLWKVSN